MKNTLWPSSGRQSLPCLSFCTHFHFPSTFTHMLGKSLHSSRAIISYCSKPTAYRPQPQCTNSKCSKHKLSLGVVNSEAHPGFWRQEVIKCHSSGRSALWLSNLSVGGKEHMWKAIGSFPAHLCQMRQGVVQVLLSANLPCHSCCSHGMEVIFMRHLHAFSYWNLMWRDTKIIISKCWVSIHVKRYKTKAVVCFFNVN